MLALNLLLAVTSWLYQGKIALRVKRILYDDVELVYPSML